MYNRINVNEIDISLEHRKVFEIKTKQIQNGKTTERRGVHRNQLSGVNSQELQIQLYSRRLVPEGGGKGKRQ